MSITQPVMKIDIITLFPEMFAGPFDHSIVQRAKNKGLLEINVHDLRNWTKDKRGTVDDKPYGGGVGMVMMAEPIVKAIEKIKGQRAKCKTVLTSPRGKVWDQTRACKYSQLEQLILICGHYEGVDERVNKFVDEEISIGDYVVTGGEIPAMVISDSITRLIPGVLEKPEAVRNESFSPGRTSLEYPQYTRPAVFRGLKVPQVLLSGNHAEIDRWRRQQAKKIATKRRPDLG